MKILLVEDDQHTRELLSATLSAHRYVVDVVADGLSGLEMATQWRYDLILLDVLMPTLNGIEVCRRLRAQGEQTPILILTTQASNEDVVTGLDAGADDYLAKSCASSQLLARVRALLRRSGNASALPVLTWGQLCFDPTLARVTYHQQPIPLRPKEYSLLELFLRHPRRIFSRSAIIDQLWSIDETPVEGSVTNLVKDLRQRLKSAGMAADLIETVYGLGYRLKAAPEEAQKVLKREDSDVLRKNIGMSDLPVLTVDRLENRDDRLHQGMVAIQQITERFWLSLEQRIAVLEAAKRSLQTGSLDLQQQKAARREAHKLVGGLGTFGYTKASEIVQTIERLLETEVNPKSQAVAHLSQLLEELKQELLKPLTEQPIAERKYCQEVIYLKSVNE
jgi:DNA-binding response OmpR family regulator/HPt (histidine-containing phosphotransfer) domain-containing protein